MPQSLQSNTDTEFRNLRNHWHMFGVAHCVTKLGRKWQVWNGAFAFPLYTTKREAMERVDSFIHERGRAVDAPTVPRDSTGRIEFPADAWRDNEEERANLSRIIETDDTDAARQWYEERAR